MRTRPVIAFSLASLTAVALAGVAATPAYAAELTASTEAELIAAIDTANGNGEADVITLTGTGFALGLSLPVITETLSIVGPGSGVFTLEANDFNPFRSIGSLTNTSFSLSGVTIENVSDTAIYAEYLDVDLDDVVVALPGDIGIRLELDDDNAVTFTDVSVSDTWYEGILIQAYDSSSIVVNRLTVADSGNDGYDGMFVYLEGDTSLEIVDADISDNGSDGLNVEAYDSASVDLDGVIADGNGADGIDVNGYEDTIVSIRDSSASGNDDKGFESEFGDDSVATFDDVTAEDNEEEGFEIHAEDAASVTMTNAVAIGNGDYGIEVETNADDAEISVIGGRGEGNESNGLNIDLFRGTITADGFIARGNDDAGIDIEGYGGTATVRNAWITDNNEAFRTGAGGIDVDAFDDEEEPLSIVVENTTIDSNFAEFGGGIGGVLYFGASLTVVNSTISGNEADIYGAIWVEGDLDSVIEIAHTTITLNESSEEGAEAAVYIDGTTTAITHTIIAGNLAGGPLADLSESGNSVLEVDFSLVRTADVNATAAMTAGTGNIVGQAPGLGPLADNGGPTLTHLPLDGSRAISAGNAAIVGAPATDQRGEDRVVGVIEIGSVEIQGAELAATGVNESTAALAAGLALLLFLGGALLMVARPRPFTVRR